MKENEATNITHFLLESHSSSSSSSSSSTFLLHVLFRPMSTDFTRPPFDNQSTPPLTIFLTLILVTLLVVGFFSIYFCRCFMETYLHSRSLRQSPSGNHLHPSVDSPAVPPGLDPLLINSFPSFPYSGIKEFRSDKFGLECAICLVEFDDDSILRLLTVCYHVFHQECIDLWLESHKTCPVCRGNLDYESPRNSTDKPPDQPRMSHHESIEDAISIVIDHEDIDANADEDEGCGSNKGKQKTQTEAVAATATATATEEEESVHKFSRSHSTGHSIVNAKQEADEDRYKLRLPEHVKMKIIRGHNWTGSCITFEEFFTNPRNAAHISHLSQTAHPNHPP